MSILSREDINDRLGRPPGERGGLVVTPLLCAGSVAEGLGHPIGRDSIDLRLGNNFLLPRNFHEAFYSLDKRSAAAAHARVYVPFGDFLVIPAHQTVLGSTLEFIKLPHDVSGQVLTKSSVARTFVIIETAPWIHPEYRGCLTLEIANVSNTPVLLYPGRYIAQLVLFEARPRAGDTDPRKEPTSFPGTYFGPTSPEAPRFPEPFEDLRAMGVSRVRVIKYVYEGG